VAREDFPLLDAAPPVVDPGVAVRLLRERFGLEGDLTELESQQDRNLLVVTPAGRYVLRFDNPATPRAELEAQDAALAHLAVRLGAEPDPLAVPRPVADDDGRTILDVDLGTGAGPGTARLLTWVDGLPLGERGPLDASTLRRVGGLVARVLGALVDLDHPGAERVCQWDLARTPALHAALAPSVPAALATRVDAAVDAAAPTITRHAAELPRQTIHGDLHPDNLLVTVGADGVARPTGLIDVGDLVVGWRIAELAVAAAGAVIRRPDAVPMVLRELVRGATTDEHALALTDVELAVVVPLVRWRVAMETMAAAHQVVIDPANDYAAEQLPRLERALDALADHDDALLGAVVALAAGRDALRVGGAPTLPARALGDWLPDHAGASAVPVDLSVTSPLLPGADWRDAGRIAAAIAGAVPAGAVPVGRWREGRLVATPPPGPTEPATVSLGVDLLVAAGTPVTSALDATVRHVDDRALVLAVEADGERAGFDVVVEGLVPSIAGAAVIAAGDALGDAAPPAAGDRLPARLTLRVTPPGVASPALAPGSLAEAWTAVCPDPSALVGIDAAAEPDDPAGLARRRDRVLARAQERYYDEPPRIERGLGAWLVDTRGRAYLDVVNNVAAVGHSHPDVTAAVSRQLGVLNTNSRFLYEPMVAFAERLVALLPDPLDSVFLVNSGSEAVETALRLARIATGRRDVVCLAGAYHGWTTATDEITTPVLGREKPIEPWVHPLASPYLHRGPHGPGSGGSEAERAARLTAEAVARIETLAASGTPPAAFVSEAFLGNAGGIALPPGYLAAVYAAVRAEGGLCVADEVQVGYGRTGTTFWAFEHEGVVPDIVTVAKMVGNGLPVAAAITTRAVAERFAEHDAFFSSSGGSPVGCAAGLAVLDVIERERLQANAAAVGERFSAGLAALAERHAVIGALHGRGLYQGVELVVDRATMTPAPVLARRVCERLREHGVICQPTGEDGDVLKVKPPLVIAHEEADAVLAALDGVLTELTVGEGPR
jgi:4-aminobutyrate aminotransferase-like enzyme/Ser/Thr protein kinase RdoA (MazF antagonist)